MQRYFSNQIINNNFVLSDDDLYHIKTVMRMKDGDLVEVVYDKKLFIGCIENVKSNIQISVVKEVEKNHKNDIKVSLIIPFLKENKLDLILQKATEMGVYKIYLCPMERCVVKLESKKMDNKIVRWKRILKEASEQSKRIEIPQIEIVDNFEKLQKMDGLNIICSTKKNIKSLKKVLTQNRKCDRINLVIGPEGGLTDSEEKILQEYDYIPITLGSNILRVETVPLCLLSMINYEFME